MRKSPLIYYPIMTSLLLSSGVCAEHLQTAAFAGTWHNAPLVLKEIKEIKDINDLTDNLQLSALLSGNLTVPRHFIDQPLTKKRVPEIKMQLKKTADNLLTEHFIPSAADNLSVDSLTTAISYRINEQLSIEGSMIGQIATLKEQQQLPADWHSDRNYNQETISHTNISESFALTASYQVSGKTQFNASYNQATNSDLPLPNKQQLVTSLTTSSPQKIAFAVGHQINNELALAVSADWQKWSSIDGDYEDIYSAGTAVSYQLKHWTLASSISVDTLLLDIENSNPLSAFEAQWNLGFSGTRKINDVLSLGITYQYQSPSGHQINGSLSDPNSSADINQGVHLISTSLSF